MLRPWCDVWLRPVGAGAAPPAAGVERARWERLRSSGDRDRLASAHALVREALGAVLGLDAAEVRVRRRCPVCGGQDHGPLDVDGAAVSVSHSAGLVAVAVTAGAPVGVDVEEVTARTPDVAELALGPRERREHAAAGTPRDLLVRWVRKEAVLKAARTGLAAGMVELRVSPPASRPRVVRWTGASRPPHVRRAALADLPAPPGYVGCVAVLTARRLAVRLR